MTTARAARPLFLAIVLAAASTPVATAAPLGGPPAAAETADAPDEQLPADVVVDGPSAPVVDPVADRRETDQRRAAALTTPIVLTGRGNGHGIGMSQYGTQGQALAGRSARDILGHYFTGSTLATESVGFDPRIGVALDQSSVRLVVRGGPATVSFGDRTVTGVDGQSWQVRVTADDRCRVVGPSATTEFAAVDGEPCLRADPVDDDATARIDVQVPSGGDWRRDGQYGRDAVVEVVADARSTTWELDVVVETTMDQYLYGLAEMPYSWEAAALRAQAIAGRSYALWRLKAVGPSPDRGCSCHLYDSILDQVYAGWDREQSQMWDRWRTAVDATSDRVISAPGQVGTQDGVVQAFYSSSSNGRTESKHELWGGTPYPYLLSVDDRWARDPATRNPWVSWEAELARPTIAARVGLDQVDGVEVTARSASGATTEVRFLGVDGGTRASVTTSGQWVRTAFGLRSTTFEPLTGNVFNDIAGSTHEGDILWIWEQDITRGCNDAQTAYCPDEIVKRGQMASFISRAFDLPAGTATFADTEGHTHEASIAALAEAGITSGCGDGSRFCPDAPVSRAEMAAFLARATGLPLASPTTFPDARGHLHERAIEAVRVAGITVGCGDGTDFCPDRGVTRGQMASFLRRATEE